jgi:hypothetical protein
MKRQGDDGMKRLLYGLFILGCFVLLMGFNLDNAIVPKKEISSGGVPKDGIPAILDPKFVAPEKADYLNASDQVIGVEIDGVSRAYPLKVLNLHEVVNDEVNGVPIAVTY